MVAVYAPNVAVERVTSFGRFAPFLNDQTDSVNG